MAMGNDLHNLNRFIEAQAPIYDRALAEIKAGSKRSHWMWFVFPQFAGLGMSATSQLYAIKNINEAKAYLAHDVLGPRLIECCEAANAVNGKTAHDIFGSPDDMKLQSSATLFDYVSDDGSVFEKLLEKYYDGQRDAKTLELIGAKID